MYEFIDKNGNISANSAKLVVIDKYGKIKEVGIGGGGAPTGPAGGDLSGTYPNPTIVWANGLPTYDLNYYPLSANPAGYLTQDNVEEYANLASFPVTGTIGTIYIALDTGLFYSWNGAAYVLSSAPNTGITGVGFTNRIPLFTSPTTLGNSIIQQVLGCVYVNRINAPSIGNTMLSIQREAGQSQIDFSLGNPTIFQESVIQSNNTEGIAFNSKGYLSLGVGLTYTEGLRILGTGQIQITQTPTTGTTSDFILLRDTLGNVKQISGGTYLPVLVPTTTGVVITFVTDRLYGSIASPETGNITADVTGAQIGVTNIIIHNSGIAPTFGAEFKKLSGSGNYVTSVVNYIYCTYINATEIIYSINQRT